MAITLTGSVPSASSFTSAYKSGSTSGSTTLKAPTGGTVTNSAGQLINDQGNVVGGAVTSSGLSYGSGTIPGTSGSYIDKGSTSVPVLASDINTTQAVKLPNNPVTQDYSKYLNDIFSTLSSPTGEAKGGTDTAAATKGDTSFADILSAELNRPAPPNSTNIYNKALKASGVADKEAAVSNYTNQLNSIVAKRDADLLSTRGTLSAEGGTEAVYGGIANTINREAAIKALPVSAQLSAAQGDLVRAEKQLDTLYKLQIDDAKATYDYKNKVLDSIVGILTKKEERQYQARKDANNRAYDLEKTNYTMMNEWAKMAVSTGQSNLVTQFTSLDPKSSTFSRDIGKLQSKVVDVNGILDRQYKQAQIDKMKADTTGQTKKEKEDAIKAQKEAVASIPTMRDKISTVGALMDDPGLHSRVGTGVLSRTSQGFWGTVGKAATGVGLLELPNDLRAKSMGYGQNFSGQVHKLVAGLTIDELTAAKARGATFGALSDSELSILSNAASAINDWEIKDKNNKGTGVWNIDEQSFKAELKTIQELTSRAMQQQQQNIFSEDETSALDAVYKVNNMVLGADNYY
jgi:hypothetical protein